MRVPIVKLYTLGGAEIYLKGESLLENSLTRFKYIYSEKKGVGDSGLLVMGFKDIDFNLGMFEPGNTFAVRWGYINDLGPRRLIALTDFDAKYSTNGWTIALKFASIAEVMNSTTGLKNSGNMQASIVEQLQMGIDLEWEYRGRDDVIIAGRITAEGVMTPYGRSYVHQNIKSPKEKQKARGIYMGWYNENAANPNLYTVPGTGNVTHLFTDDKTWDSPEQSRKRVMEKFVASINTKFPELLQYVQDSVNTGYRVVQRDASVINRKPAINSFPRFKFSNNFKQVINIHFSKKSDNGNASAHSFTALDVNGKAIISEETEVRSIVVEAGDLGFGRDANLQFIINREDDGFWYTTIGEHKLIWEEQELNAILEKIKANRDIDKIVSKEDQIDEQPNYFSVVPAEDPSLGAPKVAFEEDYLAHAPQYEDPPINEEKPWEYISTVKKGYLGIRSGPSTAELVNQIINEEKDSLFYNLEAKITIEGNPRLASNITFYLTSISSNVDGKYYIEKAEHMITRGSYTTAITSYRVDYNEEQRRKSVTQAIDDTKDNIDESRFYYNIRQVISEVMTYEEFEWMQLRYKHGAPLARQYEYVEADKDLPNEEAFDLNRDDKFKEDKNIHHIKLETKDPVITGGSHRNKAGKLGRFNTFPLPNTE